MPLWFEIKQYASEYRKIIFCAISAALTCLLLFGGVNTLIRRAYVLEPFTVGIVNHDDAAEISFVFDFFADTIAIEFLEKSEADAKLMRGDIPAYVEIPERFAADVMSGVNTPFRVIGNREQPLQWALSKLLAVSGAAYLSSSQAGIYATMDYASAHGLSRPFINERLLYPVNIAFARKLIEYGQFFTPVSMTLTGDLSPGAHYAFAFSAFWIMINLTAFTRSLRGYTGAVYARYRLAGVGLNQILLIRWIGLTCVNAVLAVPLLCATATLTGRALSYSAVTGLVLALWVSAFGLLAAALFKHDTACGLFIFTTALAMLFGSGGILPLIYLPRALHSLRFATLNHWVVSGVTNGSGAWVMAGYAICVFGMVWLVEFLSLRVRRKA